MLADHAQAHPLYQHRDMDDLVADCEVPVEGTMPIEQMPSKKISFWRQLIILMWRFMVVYWRSPQYTLFRIFVTAVIVCACYAS